MIEKIHGYYTKSNTGGYGVILSDCGDSAKLVMNNEDCDVTGISLHQVTDWLDIEYVMDEDEGEFVPVIDPDGFNVPLNLVMRA
jgi:hypothetical protein